MDNQSNKPQLMKKIALLIVVTTFLASCGATKVERQAQKTLKGEWTLTKITYPDSQGVFTVNLLQDASASCFVGSTWSFIPNNNHGAYTITDGTCQTGKRNFIFDVIETSPDSGLFDFTLKPVADGENPRKATTGYRMNLSYLSGAVMTWEQMVRVDGDLFTVQLHFSRNY